jgi:hypothetical protein
MTRSVLTYEDAAAQAAAFIEARRAKHLGFRMDASDDSGTDAGTDAAKTGDADADKEPTAEERIAALEAERDEWKTNARKHEDRAKANKDAAAELARIKAENATPDERLTAAEKRAADAEAALVRYRIAAETGIPAALLHGDDEDSIREFAKNLAEFRGEAPKKSAPKPDSSQGGRDEKKTSARDLGRAEAERRFKKN